MIKKIISIFLLLIISSGVLACNDNNENNIKETVNDFVLLSDFESRDELRKLTFVNYFGKNSINDNIDYVKHGKHSVKLEPLGYGSGSPENGKPAIRTYFKHLNTEESEYGNFGLFEYITFDVYNDNDTIKPIWVSLTDKNNQKTIDLKFELNPKAWTNIAYRIDYAKLSLTYDMKNIEFVEISFEPTRFDQTLPVFYMDKLTLVYAKEERQTAPIELDKDEICSFDKDYQEYVVTTSIMGGGGSREWVPKVSINSNQKYAKNGNSLKVDMPHGRVKDSSWPYFIFSDKLMKSIDFTKYGMNDEVVFDMYNLGKTAYSTAIYFGFSKDPKFVTTVNLEPNVWTECRFKLSELVKKVQVGKNEQTGAIIYGTDTSVLKNIDELMFVWGEFPGKSSNDNRCFYLDSIRVECKK